MIRFIRKFFRRVNNKEYVMISKDVHDALFKVRKNCNQKIKGGKRPSILSHQLWEHIYDDTTGVTFVRLEAVLATKMVKLDTPGLSVSPSPKDFDMLQDGIFYGTGPR